MKVETSPRQLFGSIGLVLAALVACAVIYAVGLIILFTVTHT